MPRLLPLLTASFLALVAPGVLPVGSIGLAETVPATRTRIIELNRQGEQLRRRGQAQTALDYYRQALQLARQERWRAGEGTLLNNIGLAYSQLSQYQQALAYYQQALAILRAVGETPAEQLRQRAMVGTTLNNMGLAYRYLGQYEQALTHYQQALTIHRTLANQPLVGSTLNNIGAVHHSRGDYSQALTFFQQALTIRQAQGDRVGESATRNNMGETYRSLGQYAEALAAYQQALQLARATGDRPRQGTILNNLGLVYAQLGQAAQALAHYEQALELARAVGDRTGEGTTLSNIGNLYNSQGQADRALRFYHQALAIHRAVQNRAMIGTTLNNIGNAYDLQGQTDKALAAYEQALALHRAVGNPTEMAITLNNLAITYQRQEQFDRALALHQQALAVRRQVGDRPGEGITLSNLGLTYLQMGQPQLAAPVLFDAVNVWESLRPGLTDDKKVSLFETQATTYRFLQQALIAQNQVEAALEVAERSRARAFVELLANRWQRAQREPDQPPVPPDVSTIRQIAQAQNATLVQYSIMQAPVQTAAGPVWQDAALYIWVIAPTGKITFRQVALSDPGPFSTNIAAQVQTLRHQLRGLGVVANHDQADPRGDRLRSRLQALHQLLIAPIAEALPRDPQQRVIFIPQGSLFLVPFPALMDAAGTYLIEQHTLLTTPSIQVLAQTRARQQQLPRPDTPQRLIVGNPVMPRYGDPPRPLAPLPGAEREARAIAQLFGEPALIQAQATEAAIKRQLPQADRIHLATHGILDDQQALNSALALTPGDREDGLLTAAELFDQPLRAGLVVLSACDTGRGRITGDGVIGLSRALIAAGVPSVIVSLWAIPDAPTATLMVDFYRHLETGLDKAQALRQAMLATKAQHPHPLNWAAFTLIGEAHAGPHPGDNEAGRTQAQK